MVRAALISPRLAGYRLQQLPPYRRGERVDVMAHIARTPDGEPVVSQEPVCDLETWHRVQEALRSRGTGARTGWGSRAWLLTGLLVCPCGNFLHGVAQPQKPDANGNRPTRYVYRCKANRRYGAGTCTGGASITAPAAEQHVVDWLFDYFSRARLGDYYEQARHARVASTERVDADLAMANEELETLRYRAAREPRGTELGQIVLGMIVTTEERVAALQEERFALTAGQPEPLTHEQLVAAWPGLNNESRRMVLRQVIHHIELSPGRGGPAERIRIVVHADQ
jgi:hypothetical protein